MSAANPVVGKIKVSVETFINTVFKAKGDAEIVYLGPEKTGLLTPDQAGRIDNLALYVDTGTFDPDATDKTGWFRRQGQYILKYYVFILDDIGTKFPIPELDLPTYIIETSKGNYQWGYVLERGYEPEEYQIFLHRLKKIKIGDGGALKLNQLIRAPAGINGKNGDTFKPHITHWNPELVFNLDDLAHEFDLPEATEEDKKFITYLGGCNPATKAQIEATPICALINGHPDTEVRLIEEGKIHIQCPNHAKHTKFTGEKESTLITRENGTCVFHCFHEHCDDFDFNQWSVNATAAMMKPLLENIPQPEESIFDQPKKERNSGFHFLSLDEVLDIPTVVKWLVSNILPMASLGMLFGLSESYKTFTVVDMACCIASGIDWHGRPVKQGLVVYIAGEGNSYIGKRFKAWMKSKGITREGMAENVIFSSRATNLSETEVVVDVIEKIKESGKTPKLIVLDTLARNFGRGNESDTKDMNLVIDHATLLREIFPETTVLFIHHTGHTNQDRGRGAYSLFAALDTEIRVEFDEKSKAITMTCTKMKDARKFDTRFFMPKVVEIEGVEEDGSASSSVVLTSQEMKDQRAVLMRQHKELFTGVRGERVCPVMEYYYDHPDGSYRVAGVALGIPHGSVRHIIDVLVNEGWIDKKEKALTAAGIGVLQILSENAHYKVAGLLDSKGV